MKALRILCAAAVASSAPLMIGGTDRTSSLEERLLAAHNRERALVGVPALTWDKRLAADAAIWADALARTGSFEHSPADPSDPDVQGENLWAGTPGAWAPEEMVGYWIAEKRDYRPGVFPSVSRSGDLEKVGHYTQLIWRSTRKVGCALARSTKEDILVCRYAEGGNVLGEAVT
ncbi:SCP-like extracellular [Sphingomonas sp. ID1715]|uniref:CAP domain-containing protein n=1 Tax=Sphingomonas sp. ID1715 TaxID=1656898 RepID=UPI00148834DC|nr:CAP domain-containing protein [Sphingomonas sp. ID1715]NNM76144.1 SCP-like extracellular [Sphingomonas sp. ID1715]